MIFTLSKNSQGSWNIRPNFGRFEGQLIATAEAVEATAVTFEGRTIVGSIRAVWGMTMLSDAIYDDKETLRGLSLRGAFSPQLQQRLVQDYDGFMDSGKKLCKAARRVAAFGETIYARGVE